jgi:hypothetical protein
MPTADVVHEKALELAGSETGTEDALSQLMESSEGKRVSVVLAHQRALRELEEAPSDPVVTRAAALLHDLLERFPSL